MLVFKFNLLTKNYIFHPFLAFMNKLVLINNSLKNRSNRLFFAFEVSPIYYFFTVVKKNLW